MSEKTGGEVMGDAYDAFDKWCDNFCKQDTTGFTEQLDVLDFINIYDIFNKEATTSRAEVLMEACQAQCSFCRDGSWSTTIDDMGAYGYEYSHLKFGQSFQPRCAASGIRKLIAADQGQGQQPE